MSRHELTSLHIIPFHSTKTTREDFVQFLDIIANSLHHTIHIGILLESRRISYVLTGDGDALEYLSNEIYTRFYGYEIVPQWSQVFTWDTSVHINHIELENAGFYPFHMIEEEDNMTAIFRLFDQVPPDDTVYLDFALRPRHTTERAFFINEHIAFIKFRFKKLLQFYRYLWNPKIEKDWKNKWAEYFEHKMHHEVFEVGITLFEKSLTQRYIFSKLLAKSFDRYKNFPYNQFYFRASNTNKITKFHDVMRISSPHMVMTPAEVGSIIQFPTNPKEEPKLLRVNSKRLPAPNDVPIPNENQKDITPIGISDYRGIRNSVGILPIDRVRHLYVIGKTGVGKSKFLSSLMHEDINRGNGFAVVDPHGDLIDEILAVIPPERHKDVVLFDPTDTEFPFAFNPLSLKPGESKQIGAKGFIDIFKKFFGANWNPKLEHVLRMIVLALYDLPGATVFDIVRALTDKDFRYKMIEVVQDDVVRNFWSNEFAGWSQQFNSEAIMPILNKVGQILSIDAIRNIFSGSENKIDFRDIMDQKKIFLVNLPKGKLQEEIMGFLGAMIVTKLYQAAMTRADMLPKNRIPFYLYIDEFQNFATDTFSEILSEARKYGLSLHIAHQFLNQIPSSLQNAVFGNVGTFVSFRVSMDDAPKISSYLAPQVTDYDLGNLPAREAYIKLLINGIPADTFSIRTFEVKEDDQRWSNIANIRDISRKQYNRTKLETVKEIKQSQSEVVERLENFSEPIL